MSAGRYVAEPARADDAPAIRALLREPMAGAVGLALEREPDHRLAAAIEGDRHFDLVVRDGTNGRVRAYGQRAVRDLWMNGVRRRVGYLGALRSAPDFRRHRRALAAAFELARRDHRPGEFPADLTSVMTDNRPARRLLERGLPDLPTYTPIGTMVTLTLRVPARSAARTDHVRCAEAHDLPTVVTALDTHGRTCHGRPVWTHEDLVSPLRCRGLEPADVLLRTDADDRLRGALALWDQRAFKQVRVASLAPRLARWRPVINAGLRLRTRPSLPAPGTQLPLVFASHIAVPNADVVTLLALVGAALARARAKRADVLSLGLPTDHPALPALRRRFGGWAAESVIYLVHDGAALALDDRLVWPEVAVL